MDAKTTLEFDPQANLCYFRFLGGRVARTVQLEENALIDLDGGNRVLGLELLGPCDIRSLKEALRLHSSDGLERLVAFFEGTREWVHA